MGRGFYRHEKAMDVYILVLKIAYRGPTYLKAKIEWWAHGRYLGFKQTLKILTIDLPKWKPYNS